MLICLQNASAQIGSTISNDKKVDWTNVGYNGNPDNNLPGSWDNIITILAPTQNPSVDRANIQTAIDAAISTSGSSNRVLVQFQQGTYRINGPLIVNGDYITLRGSGSLATKIFYEGSTNQKTNILKISGSRISSTYEIDSYSKVEKEITLSSSTSNLNMDDLIDIQVVDGNWRDTDKDDSYLENKNNQNFLGQIVRISQKVSSTKYKLEDDISIIFEMAEDESKLISFTKLDPVEEVGIENIVFESNSISNSEGDNILFEFVENSWVNEIESINSISSHITVDFSTNIEIRNSFMHQSHGYGKDRQGYGVNLRFRTTNTLVEDNIFESLRHAMIVQLSANKNVFGYNFSTKQTDTIGNKRGDISLHGHFPFANLFEGNRVDRIHADYYWGTNGPYNTFFRNFITTAEFWNENTLYTNAVGNEGLLMTYDYDYTGVYNPSYNSQENTVSVYGNNLAQHKWKPNKEKVTSLSDISYYHNNKPGFLSLSYSWPPIGPPTTLGGSTAQNIPARQEYCNTSACHGVRHSAWFNTDDMIIFREVGSGNSQINKLGYVNSTGSSFSGFGEYEHGTGEIVDISGGDFDGDGLDDIAIAKVDNRIWVRRSIGSGFVSKLDFENNFGTSIGNLASGDFNGDGLQDLGYTTEGNYSGIKSRIALYFSDAENIKAETIVIRFIDSVHFDMGGFDFHGLTSGDYDGNGVDDIAFFRKGSGSALNRILAYKINQDYTFTKIIDFQMGGYDFKGIASGDFNADGKDDLVIYRRGSGGVTTENWIITYTKNGSSLSLINSFYESGGYDLKGITSGDYDDDGIDDIGVFRRGTTLTQNFINTYTSNKTSFSEFEDFSYGGYDFKGITSGRFFHGGSNFKLDTGNSKKESEIDYKRVQLFQNYPNPFNPTTGISFVLPRQSDVSLKIYDLLGCQVAELLNGRKEAGEYSVTFDASKLSSGVYIYQLKADTDIITQKMTLIK